MVNLGSTHSIKVHLVMLQEDWIGLRELDESGKLVFETCPGSHMHFGLDWFRTTVIDAHLAGNSSRATGVAGVT